jgi:hypothetical protein
MMIKKLFRWFKPKQEKMKEDAAMTVQFLHMLEMTEEQEFSCEAVHELLDQFVELKRRGENVETLMPLVKHHLDICRECFEEYEALMAALAFEESL